MRLVFLLALLIAMPSAQAQIGKKGPTVYFVSNSGSDSNDCSSARPCATLAHVCEKISDAEAGNFTLNVADGSYAGGCDILHYHFVQVIGNLNEPDRVVVDPNHTAGFAFSAQDHATLTITALKIHSESGAGLGLKARQFVIGDFNNVTFGSMNIGVVASEHSKVNCIAGSITGKMVYFVAASDRSTISLTCKFGAISGSLSSFAWAVQASTIVATGFSYSGSSSGKKYILDGMSLGVGVNSLPGSGEIVQVGSIVQ